MSPFLKSKYCPFNLIIKPTSSQPSYLIILRNYANMNKPNDNVNNMTVRSWDSALVFEMENNTDNRTGDKIGVY